MPSLSLPFSSVAALIRPLGLLLLLLIGCQGKNPASSELTAEGPASGLAQAGAVQGPERPLGLLQVRIDPHTLAASVEALPLRRATEHADVYDMDFFDYMEGNSLDVDSFFEVLGLGLDADGNLLLDFSFAHPFAGPARLAPNRADLGITGRVVVLADSENSETWTTPEGTLSLAPHALLNADGYVHPQTPVFSLLLGTTDFVDPGGIANNAFPFVILADDGGTRSADESGFHAGPFFGNRYLNNVGEDPLLTPETEEDSGIGMAQGNYEVDLGNSKTGWDRNNWGGPETLFPEPLKWTGFDYLHQGQLVKSTLTLGHDWLSESSWSFTMTILAQWVDPRGRNSSGVLQSFPAPTNTTANFSYFLPHSALDVSEIRVPCNASFALESNPQFHVHANEGDTTTLRLTVRDWDANGSTVGFGTHLREQDPDHSAPADVGIPTVTFLCDGLFEGTLTASEVENHSGFADDPLRYAVGITNAANLTPGDEYMGLVRVADPSPVLTGRIVGEVVETGGTNEFRGQNTFAFRNVHVGDIVAKMEFEGPRALVTSVSGSTITTSQELPDLDTDVTFEVGDHVQIVPPADVVQVTVTQVDSSTELRVDLPGTLPTLLNQSVAAGWLVENRGDNNSLKGFAEVVGATFVDPVNALETTALVGADTPVYEVDDVLLLRPMWAEIDELGLTNQTLNLSFPNSESINTWAIGKGWLVVNAETGNVASLVTQLDADTCVTANTGGTNSVGDIVYFVAPYSHAGLIPDVDAVQVGDVNFRLKPVSYYPLSVRVSPRIGSVIASDNQVGPATVTFTADVDPDDTSAFGDATYTWTFSGGVEVEDPETESPEIPVILTAAGPFTGSVSARYTGIPGTVDQPVVRGFAFTNVICPAPSWSTQLPDSNFAAGRGRGCSVGIIPSGTLAGRPIMSYVDSSENPDVLRIVWATGSTTFAGETTDVASIVAPSTSLQFYRGWVVVAFLHQVEEPSPRTGLHWRLRLAVQEYGEGLSTGGWTYWDADTINFHGTDLAVGTNPIDLTVFEVDAVQQLAILFEKEGAQAALWTQASLDVPNVGDLTSWPDHPLDWNISIPDSPAAPNGGGGIVGIEGGETARLAISYYLPDGDEGALRRMVSEDDLTFADDGTTNWESPSDINIADRDIGRYNDLAVFQGNRLAVIYYDIDLEESENAAVMLSLSSAVGASGAPSWASPLVLGAFDAAVFPTAEQVAPLEIRLVDSRLAAVFYDLETESPVAARACVENPAILASWSIDSTFVPGTAGNLTGTSCAVAPTSGNQLVFAFRQVHASNSTSTIGISTGDASW